jgi:ornithine decarboxylase
MSAMTDHFGNDLPQMIVEPGRSLVGDSGIIEAEVVLISKKGYEDDVRWVYLDIGKFGGLAETMDEAIKYRIQTPERSGAAGPVVLAGPTCDSADILYEKYRYKMPLSLQVGDADSGDRGVHDHLRRDELQRLQAAGQCLHLSSLRGADAPVRVVA